MSTKLEEIMEKAKVDKDLCCTFSNFEGGMQWTDAGGVKHNDRISSGVGVYEPDGTVTTGMEYGANNGYYAFAIDGSMMITRDKETAEKMRYAYPCRDTGMCILPSIGVKLDLAYQQEKVEKMEQACETKAYHQKENAEMPLRTEAVRRGDLITMYDPNSPEWNPNVAHYKVDKEGRTTRISCQDARLELIKSGHITGYQNDSRANMDNYGKKLDAATIANIKTHGRLD